MQEEPAFTVVSLALGDEGEVLAGSRHPNDGGTGIGVRLVAPPRAVPPDYDAAGAFKHKGGETQHCTWVKRLVQKRRGSRQALKL